MPAWLKINDADMPPKDRRVLLWLPGFRDTPCLGYWIPNEFVTHWMDLPEPPAKQLTV